MNISILIDRIPDDLKNNIIDFTTVKNNKGEYITRVIIDHILTDVEINDLLKCNIIANKRYVGTYLNKNVSYFYIK